MLGILDEIVIAVGRVHSLSDQVARRDPWLARQMKQTSRAVGVHVSECVWSSDVDRSSRLLGAVSGSHELIVALEVCGAAKYLGPEIVAAEVSTFDRIIRGLRRLARKRR